MRLKIFVLLGSMFAPSVLASAPVLPDATERFIRSVSRNPYRLADLRYYAQARVHAASVNVRDSAAVRQAMDHVFAARGCLARDFNDFVYQNALVQRIDETISGPDGGQMWSAVLHADRNNIRKVEGHPGAVCPIPHPQERARQVNFNPWGDGASATARPVAIGLKPAFTTSSAGPASDASTRVKDELRRFVLGLALAAKEQRALDLYAATLGSLLGIDTRDGRAVTQAWYAVRDAEACVVRDFTDPAKASNLMRQVDDRVSGLPEGGPAIVKVRSRIDKLDPEPAAMRPIQCPINTAEAPR